MGWFLALRAHFYSEMLLLFISIHMVIHMESESIWCRPTFRGTMLRTQFLREPRTDSRKSFCGVASNSHFRSPKPAEPNDFANYRVMEARGLIATRSVAGRMWL